MSPSVVSVVLFVIDLSLIAVSLYLYKLARDRKAYAFNSMTFFTGLLRVLHREAATPERKGDAEFAALIARFEAAHIEARSALNRCRYRAVIRIIDGAEQELAEFRRDTELWQSCGGSGGAVSARG